ncbi:sensor domain-containing protein [[Mycobacterium] wendilense]|uniref:Sensor domain-containing protein n=1 Tax=[Mycobacterium] wendilense TaxID=3064284 RepID=A0ABN9P4C2_9MYCO|nr:sensor domain-containing protein [Mycolicibacterium sp. MU0050]CAJ1584225.1 sensor domain-containing protein [Mycolicibacterium sp. MU0050]
MNRSSLPVTGTAVAGAAVVATMVFGAAPAAALTGPARGADSTPTFTYVSQLESLLPTAQQLGRITGASAPMRLVGSGTELSNTTGTLEPAACVGAFEPGRRAAYPGVEPSAVAIQIVTDGKPGRARHFVHQVVLSVADAQTATEQLRESTRTWSSCGGQPLRYTNKAGEVAQWLLDDAELLRGETLLVQGQTGDNVVCERALTTAAGKTGPVIADVLACDLGGRNATGQAQRIALTIADNVTPSS